MSTPLAGVPYYYDTAAAVFRAPGRPDLPLRRDADELFEPISFGNFTEAREALGVPSDASIVPWTFGNMDLETVFATQLGPNDILGLPERAEPYYIDSSKGFMAAGVNAVDGVGADGLKDGSKIPIVSNSRLWFEMTRARRGIIGLGPGAVVAPSPSSFSQQAQPILENQVEGNRFQTAYFTSGATQNLNGAQTTLIGYDHARPFFANFRMTSRSFGGVSYSSLKRTGGTGQHDTFKRLFLDGSWRAHAGVPNGECGGISMNRGTYLIENCDLVSVNGGSPIMWNNNGGGNVRNVRSTRPDIGMWTFWRCGGTNIFENCYVASRQTGINIEENLAGFELDWTEGSFTLEYSGNKFHFSINPAGGAPKIALHGVDVSRNAYTSNAMTANIYTTSGVAKRSWITCDTLPVSCVPSNRWID